MITRLKSWLIRLALRLIGRLAADDANEIAAARTLARERDAGERAPTTVREAADRMGKNDF